MIDYDEIKDMIEDETFSVTYDALAIRQGFEMRPKGVLETDHFPMSGEYISEQLIREQVVGTINTVTDNTCYTIKKKINDDKDNMIDRITDRMLKVSSLKKKEETPFVPNKMRKYHMAAHYSLTYPVNKKNDEYMYNKSKYTMEQIAAKFLDGEFDNLLYSAMTRYYGYSDLVNAFIASLKDDRFITFVDSFLSAVFFDDQLLKDYFGIERIKKIDTSGMKNDRFFGGKKI